MKSLKNFSLLIVISFLLVVPFGSAAWWDGLTGSYQVFNETGSFNFTPPSTETWLVEVLVLGGGGGGGGDDTNSVDREGGGGGAGGLLLDDDYSITPGQNISINVGTGGPGGLALDNPTFGTNGGNSSFGTLIAIGGGGGAANFADGNDGGSGGGGSPASSSSTSGGAGTPGQGNSGGGSSSASNVAGSGGGALTGGTPGGVGGSGLLVWLLETLAIGGDHADAASANVSTGSGGGGANDNNNGGDGGSGLVIVRWIPVTIGENMQWNETSYQMLNEGFTINITNENLTDIKFNYNNVNYTPTQDGEIYSYNLDVPIDLTGIIPLYWSANNGSDTIYTQTYNQTISETTLGLCNATLNVTYLNFTFLDEEVLTALNSTMEFTNLRYWIGSGNLYKELTFQNTSENPSYGFCFSAQSKTLSMTATEFRYSSDGFPQRIHTRISDLTNSTTTQILYLLANADGQYTTIITQSVFGTPIQDIAIVVERQFSGTYTTIGEDITDSSGASTFWLNPDYDHRFTLSGAGYATQVLIFRPTLSQYIINMGSGLNATDLEYVSISDGISYAISPSPMTTLNQSTSYTFQFNVESSRSNLVSYKVNFTDFDGNFLGNASGSFAAGSDLSLVLNTGTNKSIIAYYFVDTGSGLGLIFKNDYKIIDVDPSDLSLSKTIGYFNINNENLEQQYGYFFFFFFIFTMLIASVTHFTNVEISQPGSSMAVVGMVTFVLSLLGFFTINFTTNDLINQFGIALPLFFIIGGFVLGRFNRI